MLILGIVAGCWSAIMLHRLRLLVTNPMGLWTEMSFFFLPAIMFVEAAMYWIVRRRIVYRKAAWGHILLFALAYSLHFLGVYWDYFLLRIPGVWEMYVNNGSILYLAQLCLFWSLTLVAHIFFARVLIKAFSKPPAIQEGSIQPENMLDDVLD
jgi:hypothetical protein